MYEIKQSYEDTLLSAEALARSIIRVCNKIGERSGLNVEAYRLRALRSSTSSCGNWGLRSELIAAVDLLMDSIHLGCAGAELAGLSRDGILDLIDQGLSGHELQFDETEVRILRLLKLVNYIPHILDELEHLGDGYVYYKDLKDNNTSGLISDEADKSLSCYVPIGANNVECKFESDGTFRLLKSALFNIPDGRLNKKYSSRLQKLQSNGSLEIIESSSGTRTVSVKEDIKFLTAKSLVSFIFGRDTKNSTDLIRTRDGRSLKELIESGII